MLCTVFPNSATIFFIYRNISDIHHPQVHMKVKKRELVTCINQKRKFLLIWINVSIPCLSFNKVMLIKYVDDITTLS